MKIFDSEIYNQKAKTRSRNIAYLLSQLNYNLSQHLLKLG